jgi:rod shape-determining protein MreC
VFRNTRTNVVYVLIFAFFFIFFFLQPQITTSLKVNLIDITSWPLHIVSAPLNEGKKIIFYHRTYNEYKKLRQRVDVLQARLIGLNEVIKENTRLETLLDFKRKLVYSSVSASVIGRDPSYWNAVVIIDKGKRDGLKKGQAVVNASGVVGKIVEAGNTRSKVVLLTDPQFSVAALLQEPRESVLVSGTLEGVCKMRYLNERSDVKLGDKVITSKLSASFPDGLLIGEVVEIDENPDHSREYIVEPAVSLSQLEEVLVIVK